HRDLLAEILLRAVFAERAEDLVDQAVRRPEGTSRFPPAPSTGPLRGRAASRPAQHRERRAQPVAVGIAALQVPLAGLRVARAAVQHTQVVDDEEVAGLDLEPDPVALLL